MPWKKSVNLLQGYLRTLSLTAMPVLILKVYRRASCLSVVNWRSFPPPACCDIRTQTSPRWNNPLFSSQDQYHPNPTWQRRKLVLPWSALNRRALFFYSAAHLNEGRGLSVPTPGWSPCHCHYHHESSTQTCKLKCSIKCHDVWAPYSKHLSQGWVLQSGSACATFR